MTAGLWPSPGPAAGRLAVLAAALRAGAAGLWPSPGPAAGRLAVLAAALRAGAAGLYCAEAGVELLICQGAWLRRGDFTGSFIAVTPGLAGRAAVAVIGWDAAVAALDGGALPCGGGERRILHLAASIAAGIPADLGEALTGLDRAGITAAARAVLHAGGHRDAMVTLPPGI